MKKNYIFKQIIICIVKFAFVPFFLLNLSSYMSLVGADTTR